MVAKILFCIILAAILWFGSGALAVLMISYSERHKESRYKQSDIGCMIGCGLFSLIIACVLCAWEEVVIQLKKRNLVIGKEVKNPFYKGEL